MIRLVLDHDLCSVQEARDLVRKAGKAQEEFAGYDGKKIDAILQAMVKAVEENAEKLARMAVEETKYGVLEHKAIKNLFAARDVYNFIKDLPTTGIIKEDSKNKIIEAAVPMGVIVALTPTTNPTSTVIHNAMIALKAGNAVVFSPHPNAAGCSASAAEILHQAAVKAGAPEGLIGCVTRPTLKATEELMQHKDVAVIVATGGSAMVKAAYSAGKPAFGVGPGNVPVFIERSADIKQAVKDIITSKTFDNGMICASEQAVIADAPVKEQVIAEFKKQGAYFLNEKETEKVSTAIMKPGGAMNPAFIAKYAGLNIPADTKLLIAPLQGFGPDFPLSFEKLTTVLGFYTVKDWEEACNLSIELLNLGGIGHTFAIHSRDEKIIREFIRKPVFRIVVNTPSALGAIGYSTALTPSLTLGCGTWGGSSISDNLSPLHLINVKRLAFGIKPAEIPKPSQARSSSPCPVTDEDIADIVREVLKKLQA